MSLSIIIILVFVILIYWGSQRKFRNKVLCTFIRPNRQEIERWVPLHSKYVIFEKRKGEKSQYIIDPNCMTTMLYDRGLNKLFPVPIYKLTFRWDTPNPLNPNTFQSTWHTPEARDAAWEEHQHIAFSKGIGTQIGGKSKFPAWFFPVITLILVFVVLLITYQGLAGLDERMFNLEQMIKVR